MLARSRFFFLPPHSIGFQAAPECASVVTQASKQACSTARAMWRSAPRTAAGPTSSTPKGSRSAPTRRRTCNSMVRAPSLLPPRDGVALHCWWDHCLCLTDVCVLCCCFLCVVEEQKRLYQELPFMALPGMRRQSFQRERSFSNLKSRSSWGSFTNLVQVRTAACIHSLTRSYVKLLSCD